MMRTHIVWFCIAAVALFSGRKFATKEIRVVEKPVEIVKIKEVPRDVEKIVEQRVEVPAKIPEIYETALAFREKFLTAKLVLQKEALAGVESVSVAIDLADDVKKIVSESEIRTKFEITLRRSGVPINEKSRFTLAYTQDGFTKGNPTLAYSITTALQEAVVGFRNGDPGLQRYIATWTSVYYGTVGVSKAREALLSQAESAAEEFANEWLAMNLKK